VPVPVSVAVVSFTVRRLRFAFAECQEGSGSRFTYSWVKRDGLLTLKKTARDENSIPVDGQCLSPLTLTLALALAWTTSSGCLGVAGELIG
jgi:hypothetical protein